jgi:hypothetical protein
VPFLLGLGGGVEVLGPPEVRAEVARRLREAVGRYGGEDGGAETGVSSKGGAE